MEPKQLQMRHRLEQIPELYVPDGFYVRPYRPGDEAVWAEICKNGLLNPTDGAEAWNTLMLAQRGLVPERDVFFLCTQATGYPVATVAGYIREENGLGNVHMVAARPGYAGNGLGWAMVTLILNKMKQELPPDGLLGLRTDDWRIPAIVGYLRGGFQPVLLDDTMEPRWRAICERLNFHGIEMVAPDGSPTGILL